MKRFVFIEAWKKVWPIELLCRVLQVTSRGYRAWRARPMSRRQRADLVFLPHLRRQISSAFSVLKKLSTTALS